MVEKHKPLTHMVYEKIYAGIINGAINGNDILTEYALVEQLKVSKSPVREALIMLCEEGALQSIPRTGYRVVQITPTQVDELVEARLALEPFMFKKAWEKIGENELARLEAHWVLAKEDEKVHTSVKDNWRRNIDFHMMLAGFSENGYLEAMLCRTLKTCARAVAQYFLQVRRIPHGEGDIHNAILSAMRARDRDTATALLLEDIRQIV